MWYSSESGALWKTGLTSVSQIYVSLRTPPVVISAALQCIIRVHTVSADRISPRSFPNLWSEKDQRKIPSLLPSYLKAILHPWSNCRNLCHHQGLENFGCGESSHNPIKLANLACAEHSWSLENFNELLWSWTRWSLQSQLLHQMWLHSLGQFKQLLAPEHATLCLADAPFLSFC